MDTDLSHGIVPVRMVDEQRYYLLVQHLKGHWGFPKGHPEPGETAIEAARRELAEETGLRDVRVLNDSLMRESYVFTKKSGRRVRKTVMYFIGVVEGAHDARPQPDEIANCRWLVPDEARRMITFPESRDLLERAERYLDTHLSGF